MNWGGSNYYVTLDVRGHITTNLGNEYTFTGTNLYDGVADLTEDTETTPKSCKILIDDNSSFIIGSELRIECSGDFFDAYQNLYILMNEDEGHEIAFNFTLNNYNTGIFDFYDTKTRILPIVDGAHYTVYGELVLDIF